MFESRSLPALPTPALFTSAVIVGSVLQSLGHAPNVFLVRQIGSHRLNRCVR